MNLLVKDRKFYWETLSKIRIMLCYGVRPAQHIKVDKSKDEVHLKQKEKAAVLDDGQNIFRYLGEQYSSFTFDMQGFLVMALMNCSSQRASVKILSARTKRRAKYYGVTEMPLRLQNASIRLKSNKKTSTRRCKV